jgi:hypothetical protein
MYINEDECLKSSEKKDPHAITVTVLPWHSCDTPSVEFELDSQTKRLNVKDARDLALMILNTASAAESEHTKCDGRSEGRRQREGEGKMKNEELKCAGGTNSGRSARFDMDELLRILSEDPLVFRDILEIIHAVWRFVHQEREYDQALMVLGRIVRPRDDDALLKCAVDFVIAERAASRRVSEKRAAESPSDDDIPY